MPSCAGVNSRRLALMSAIDTTSPAAIAAPFNQSVPPLARLSMRTPPRVCPTSVSLKAKSLAKRM